MKDGMRKLLLRIARMPFLGWFIGRLIAHFAHALPLRIVFEDTQCIAFHHPSPSYNPHLLVMLRTHAHDVSVLSAEQLRQALAAARSAVRKLGLAADHIMFWTNCGRFQDVKQLHFHLFPSHVDHKGGLHVIRTLRIDGIDIREGIRSGEERASLLIIDGGTDAFVALLPRLISAYRLESRGYSVFWDLSENANRSDRVYIRMG